MGRALTFCAAALAVLTLAGPAGASGDGPAGPWYLDQFGGEKADLQAFFDGRVGIVMARAPRPRLLAAWRMLHGLKVGREAGEALSKPCCSDPYPGYSANPPPNPIDLWTAARKGIAGAPPLASKDIETERQGPDFTTTTICYGDAFQTAADTLMDRSRRYGANSPAVRAWLTAQDKVFEACNKPGAGLPPLATDAPAWLRADYAYQEAAFDLYSGHADRAGARFGAIAADPASPWRPWGLYLQARALERHALDHRSPEAAAAARKAIAALAAGPPGTLLRGEVVNLSNILEFRYDPAGLMAEIDRDLRQPDPPKTIDTLFRDYSDLADAAKTKPEIADWMATMTARPDIPNEDTYSPPTLERVQAYAAQRQANLKHAIERWRTTRDRAWLLAALSLINPGEADVPALLRDGEAAPAAYPGWLTIQHHLVRLSLVNGDPVKLRRRLDALLARKDLSLSDRNIFLSERTQISADLHDFARHALRRRLCEDAGYDAPRSSGCARNAYSFVTESANFDKDGGKGTIGFGEDARAIIDRMPLSQRMALSNDTTLPAKLRMDIALTNFPRALQLSDDNALDALARQLEPMLPQLARDWRRIPATAPGPDKRFAVYMVMAKIPGLRVDLVDYVRPEGSVRQFQRHWMDWIVMARGKPLSGLHPPALAEYQTGGYTPAFEQDTKTYKYTHATDARSDLACLGECGRGAAPLRVPTFVDRRAADAERAYFVQRPDSQALYDYAARKPIAAPPAPPGGVVVWNEILAYGAAHPNDPRIPESLYWIIHASHFGGSHEQSGKRAFQRLQLRYGHTIWARRAPVYSE